MLWQSWGLRTARHFISVVLCSCNLNLSLPRVTSTKFTNWVKLKNKQLHSKVLLNGFLMNGQTLGVCLSIESKLNRILDHLRWSSLGVRCYHFPSAFTWRGLHIKLNTAAPVNRAMQYSDEVVWMCSVGELSRTFHCQLREGVKLKEYQSLFWEICKNKRTPPNERTWFSQLCRMIHRLKR